MHIFYDHYYYCLEREHILVYLGIFYSEKCITKSDLMSYKKVQPGYNLKNTYSTYISRITKNDREPQIQCHNLKKKSKKKKRNETIIEKKEPIFFEPK